MTRDVDLVGYFPPYLQRFREPVQVMQALDPEFDAVWSATDKVLQNRFISTADATGISRYEAMIGITPTEDDTLESRRRRCQSRWYSSIPYTYKALLVRLQAICGDTDFEVRNNFSIGYTLRISVSVGLHGQMDEIADVVAQMIPCNLVAIVDNSIYAEPVGTECLGSGVICTQVLALSDSGTEYPEITGGLVYSGGTIITEASTIVDEYNSDLEAKVMASEVVTI